MSELAAPIERLRIVSRRYAGAIVGQGQNVELKARDPDPAQSLAVCASLPAEDRGVLRQRDTYFQVARGRLKLREEEGATAHLIAYERSDEAAQRESDYRIVAIEDAQGLKAALGGAVGVRVVVAKERRLFVWNGVRIHLDRVKGLGEFIELEGVIGEAGLDPARAGRGVEELRRAFGLADECLIGKSYCDLAIARVGR